MKRLRHEITWIEPCNQYNTIPRHATYGTRANLVTKMKYRRQVLSSYIPIVCLVLKAVSQAGTGDVSMKLKS